MITGNGTVESPYVISGSTVKEVWDEMREKIKLDGVYVELDQAYTFDIDELYKGSVVPDGIEIGYGTILDGKGSDLKSETLKAEAFDFEGTYAIINNFTTLPYKESVATECLKIVDTREHILSAVQLRESVSYYTRIKCVPNQTIDFNNEENSSILYITCNVFQAENLTIKNHRDLQLYMNANRFSTSVENTYYVYNLNVIDCYARNRSNINEPAGGKSYLTFYECYFKLYNYYNLCWISITYSGISFKKCSISLFSNGSMYFGGDTLANFYDCIVYLENCLTDRSSYLNMGYFYDSYIHGSISNTRTVGERANYIQCILEFTTNDGFEWYRSSSNGTTKNTVINCSEGFIPKYTVSNWSGVTFLATDEIRDSKKLYAAGVPANPNRTAE